MTGSLRALTPMRQRWGRPTYFWIRRVFFAIALGSIRPVLTKCSSRAVVAKSARYVDMTSRTDMSAECGLRNTLNA